MKFLVPLVLVAIVIAAYGSPTGPEPEPEAVEEEAIKKRWGDGCRNLQKWLQDNWWKPWYETEDDVPDEEKQALKVMGEELASGLHLFGSLLDDDDTAVGDDEDSEYFFRGIARAISGIRRRKKGGRRKGKKGCKCC